jgi:hypothetical protein
LSILLSFLSWYPSNDKWYLSFSPNGRNDSMGFPWAWKGLSIIYT